MGTCPFIHMCEQETRRVAGFYPAFSCLVGIQPRGEDRDPDQCPDAEGGRKAYRLISL